MHSLPIGALGCFEYARGRRKDTLRPTLITTTQVYASNGSGGVEMRKLGESEAEVGTEERRL